jgi:dTDP-4-dehydrorhamnose reductase
MQPGTLGRSLIVGISGQVGSQIASLLGPGRVVGTTRNPSELPHRIPADLALLAGRKDDARELIEHSEADAVYCAGGMTDVERCECEPELAIRTNCHGPATLAAAAASRNLPFVYFSTEYVFDGNNGPYAEDAPANPMSAYGKSKWMGEVAVREAHPNPLIIRTTVVYGPDPGGRNFLYSLRRAANAGKPFHVPADQISTPTYNRDLAAAATGLVAGGASGVFHVAGPDRISRLDLANRAARAMAFSTSYIVGVTTLDLGQRARRPLNAGLSTGKLRLSLPNQRMRGVEESILAWTTQPARP